MAKGGTSGQGPYAVLLKSSSGSAAWKVLSFGARSLFLALSGHCSNHSNLAYLSYRNAGKELGIGSHRKISEWYKELQHYRFIVLHRYGSLGTKGKAKAPQWRITDRGNKASGELTPTRDFMRWDGVLFEPDPRTRFSTIAPDKKGRRRGQATGKLDMCTTPGTGFYFPPVYHAGDTSDDEHELAKRFLTALGEVK
jgi:hypothetical protein